MCIGVPAKRGRSQDTARQVRGMREKTTSTIVTALSSGELPEARPPKCSLMYDEAPRPEMVGRLDALRGGRDADHRCKERHPAGHKGGEPWG